jgi:endonuclease/exonuclease/phosphatase (EEP) superfamily protein YafD
LEKKAILPKIFRGVLLFANVGVIIWLLLCKYVSYANPVANPSVLSLISFTCFFALLGNLVFVIIWLFSKRKKRALFSLITIIICWNVVSPLFGLNYFGRNRVAPTEEKGLKIMTWNVHLFDLGEWTKDKASKAKIIKLIRDENPDIVCLEEFYFDAKEPAEPYTEILQQLGYPFMSFALENEMNKSHITSNSGPHDIINVGHAIFSKYPLRNTTTYPLFSESYKMLSVELIIDSSNIFSLNVVHLTSVGFARKDLDYITKIKADVDAQDEGQSKSLLRKLRDSSANRALLANRIDSLKREMDYPQIICGDFNDVPGSYVYTRVKGKLSDAFVGKGSGLGRTYHNISPTLRIDYILYDDNALKIEGYKRPDVDLSDHYPVIANFSLRKRKK